MADERTKKILLKWNFKELLDIFEEQQIDFETLKTLDEGCIRDLIPLVGPRSRFISKWTAEFSVHKKNNLENTDKSQPSTSTESTTINPLPVDFDSSDNSGIEDENSSEADDSSRNFPKAVSQPIRKRKFSLRESEYRKHLKEHNGKYVLNLLRRHNFGEALIKEYKRENFLTEKSSIYLCKIISDDLITSTHSTLSNADFNDLTDEILSIFQTERSETYFIPPIPKSESKTKNSVRARGRLVDAFYNRLQTYRRMCGEPKRKKLKSSRPKILISKDIQRSLSWLEHNHNHEDFTEVKKHWKATTKTRHAVIVKEDKTVSQYLKQYPILLYSYCIDDTSEWTLIMEKNLVEKKPRDVYKTTNGQKYIMYDN